MLNMINEIIDNGKAGTYRTILIQNSNVGILKKYEKQGIHVGKQTKITMSRLGVGYDNMKTVQEKRENGDLPEINQGLKGVKWLRYPYTLISVKTQKVLLRVSLCKDSKITTKWVLNGEPATYEQVEPYLLASEKRKNNKPDVINVKIENIGHL